MSVNSKSEKTLKVKNGEEGKEREVANCSFRSNLNQGYESDKELQAPVPMA